ncbi:MAG TPA: ATP-dependent protease subunit HslV [bacterium]|nr:ATP-dependent protease subunit HslV [bacterium]HOL48367.1 ATP-dependent protease subunit HslV [bacterium]HPQ19466.1 ATP-dependent protease subunit HslV [bacterium]
MKKFRSTTILAIYKENYGVIAGDGQVTAGETIIKSTSNKIRKLFKNNVLVGFAGAAADAITLFDKFEEHLQKNNGQLYKSAVELAKEWRTDRILRRLSAQLAVVSKEGILLISGSGDVIQPDDGIIAIGSGGPFALAAARALLKFSKLPLKKIAEEAIRIAAEICIYTNENIIVEELK